MQVICKRLTDVQLVKESMTAVRGKKMKDTPLDPSIWYEMLLSPHSSVRAVLYRVYVQDIPYYAHVHLVRHKIGIEPTVYSQRSNKERGSLPQDSLISMHFDINAQALINIAKVRLCNKADNNVREVFNLIKNSLSNSSDKYDQILGKLLMSNCEFYDGLCSEPKPCGRVGCRSLKEVHRGLLCDSQKTGEKKNDTTFD